MKAAPLLLVLSLAGNAACLALLLLRPAPPAPLRAPVAATASGQVADTRSNDSLLAALARGDSAALTAAGVAPEIVRQLAAARAFGRLAAISRAMEGPPATAARADYWRQEQPAPRPPPTREQRAERFAAEREFQDAMRRAFGEELDFDGGSRQRSFLSAEKQEQLRRIERDYEEMSREITDGAGGLQLAADREKIKLLNAEKERDIAAALTPAEREQIELRTSRSAQSIIGRYGDVIASEEEYKRLYALQKAFDDQYNDPNYARPRRTDDKLRAAAERQLNDDLRAALGEERWAAQSRATDGEYRLLGDLANRLSLPASTPDQVYAVRDTYAAQSLAIYQNSALSDTERRAQLAALAAQAKTDLTTRLGTEGAATYADRSGWLRMLQNGAAFTTDARNLPAGSPRPGGGSTVYPLPPPKK